MPDKSQNEDATLKALLEKEYHAHTELLDASNRHDPMAAEIDQEYQQARAERERYQSTHGDHKATQEQKPTPHGGTTATTETRNEPGSSADKLDKQAHARAVVAPTSCTSPEQPKAEEADRPREQSQSFKQLKAAIDHHAQPNVVAELYNNFINDVHKASQAHKQVEAAQQRITAEQETADEDLQGEDEIDDEEDFSDEAESETESLKVVLAEIVRADADIRRVLYCRKDDGEIIDFSARPVEYKLRSFARSLILPTKMQPFQSTRELFDKISALLQKHAMLPKNECAVLAYWSMATWFTEYLPFIPSLEISGPAVRADLLFRTLAAVCRQPVLLAELNAVVLRNLPIAELKMITLLVRESRLNNRMTALLNASNQPGYLFFNGEKFHELYCPKCIYVGESVKGQPFSSSSIQIYIAGNSSKPLHLPPTNEIRNELQNQLLYYRVWEHEKVAASNFRVACFQPEVCAIAEVLGAAIVDDPDLQRGIIDLLKDRDEQSRVERASGLNGMVLRAVLFHCHEKEPQKVFVREIAATVNRIAQEEGEPVKVANETVGHVLKYLGLYSRRLGSTGRGLVLDDSIQSRAHRLGQTYEVLVNETACRYCHDFQTTDSAGVMQEV